MSSTWSSGTGKFVKKDPDHGKWWRKIKAWYKILKNVKLLLLFFKINIEQKYSN